MASPSSIRPAIIAFATAALRDATQRAVWTGGEVFGADALTVWQCCALPLNDAELRQLLGSMLTQLGPDVRTDRVYFPLRDPRDLRGIYSFPSGANHCKRIPYPCGRCTTSRCSYCRRLSLFGTPCSRQRGTQFPRAAG